jgi:hypothetical protein
MSVSETLTRVGGTEGVWPCFVCFGLAEPKGTHELKGSGFTFYPCPNADHRQLGKLQIMPPFAGHYLSSGHRPILVTERPRLGIEDHGF